jgi:RNA polymerase sigma factor (sigma-70 family)
LLKIYFRKNAWRNGARLTYVDEIHEDAAGAVQPPPSFPSDAEYTRGRIEKALAQIPPLLREAYTLFQIGGLSIREIAHGTGISENLVKVQIHSAKEKLQPPFGRLARKLTALSN